MINEKWLTRLPLCVDTAGPSKGALTTLTRERSSAKRCKAQFRVKIVGNVHSTYTFGVKETSEELVCILFLYI